MKFPINKIHQSGYGFMEKTPYGTHRGIDFRASFESLHAPTDGVVSTFLTPNGGNWVSLATEDLEFRFAHLQSFIKVGQVKKGDIIAITGNSGNLTSGAHLHLEIKSKGKYIDPNKVFMIYNILIENLKNLQTFSDALKSSVADFFAKDGYSIVFYTQSSPSVDYWAKIHISDAGGIGCDIKDTRKTPDWYDITWNWANQSLANQSPEQVLIHEILHGLYEDAKLRDIHSYGWGVKDNQKVVEYLINNSGNISMKYVMTDDKEQYLLDEQLKIALNIANPEELKKLQDRGLIGSPDIAPNIDGYLVYPLVSKEHLKDIFGF